MMMNKQYAKIRTAAMVKEGMWKSPTLLSFNEVDGYSLIEMLGFDDHPMAGWDMRCPVCLEWSPCEEWPGLVDCEDCGEHDAICCPSCWSAWDKVLDKGHESSYQLKFTLHWGNDTDE